ncbi:MAG: hypothetical protein HN922_12010 [Anaerolineae bacterium]|nr:hypothetical protein [Anaerolineae bacterium]MBT7783777.1 hypothetical protein [Anaerolineae bacterium]
MATSLEPTEYSLTILCFLSILLGLFAEFQVRTYHATQCKPTYILRETINIE